MKRTAHSCAVSGFYGQIYFGILCREREKGTQPYPKYTAYSPQGDTGRYTYYVACAYAASQCGTQSTERRYSVLFTANVFFEWRSDGIKQFTRSVESEPECKYYSAYEQNSGNKNLYHAEAYAKSDSLIHTAA